MDLTLSLQKIKILNLQIRNINTVMNEGKIKKNNY